MIKEWLYFVWFYIPNRMKGWGHEDLVILRRLSIKLNREWE